MEFQNIEELKKDLISFENEISDIYKQAKIKAPVHLSKGNEAQLIEIFKHVKKDDWMFATYRNHYQALLKGVDRQWLKDQIIEGHSMHIMSKEHKIYTTSIVGGQLPIAVGAALALKLKGAPGHVWAFCGDMAAETGVFHECTKFSAGHNLPITFIVEDDGLSVYTPTKESWGGTMFRAEDNLVRNYDFAKAIQTENPKSIIKRYAYKREWPHHGIGLWVEFPEDKLQEEADGRPMYQDEVKRAMELLSKDPRVYFIGQTVGCKGSSVYGSVQDIPISRRIELPIIEEVQMGISTGMALEGLIPISIYPRIDFMVLASNQLINHLDKTKELSGGVLDPKVIIRTMVGSKTPLYPGPQHCQDHTEAYKQMLTNIDVVKLEKVSDIVPAYLKALQSDKSTLFVEPADLYFTR